MTGQSTDSIADNSGRFHWKSADSSRNHPRASVISADAPPHAFRSKGAGRNFLTPLCVFIHGAHVQSPHADPQTNDIGAWAASQPGPGCGLSAVRNDISAAVRD